MFLAKPKRTIPPQSPSFLLPVPSLEVKIIGLAKVPIAFNFAPRVTINEPCVGLSPRIIVPGAIVKVALFFTYILFCNKITPLQVVLVVMSVETVIVVAG